MPTTLSTGFTPPSRLRHALLPVLVASTLLAGCTIQPQPFTESEKQVALSRNRAQLTQQQEPVTGPITLDEAMARAVKYNLDHRLKLMEQALAQSQLDLASFDLLPKLTAQAGYTTRSNTNAASSTNVATGQQSLAPSTSEDKTLRTADLALSWNVLDFGVSYYTAKQQADRVLAANERRRKVLQMLMQQTRQAYWQAAGAQMMESKVDPILQQAQQALEDSRRVEKENLKAPLETLNYQRQLLDIVRQLEAVRDELSQAKPRLASIMNLEPGQPFQLAPPTTFGRPQIIMPVSKMEETALLNRPEILEASYNERISVLETRKAISKLLPGIELNLGEHYSSNSFLVNNNWGDAGLRVSWNLFNLLNAGNIRRDAEAQRQVAHTQRMALYMAVLTQVQVANRDYQGKQRQFELNQQINSVDQRILMHTHNAAQASAQSKLEEIRAAASAMMSELRMYESYGALQSSYGQLVSTLGLDPISDHLQSHDLASLQTAINQAQQQWIKVTDSNGTQP